MWNISYKMKYDCERLCFYKFIINNVIKKKTRILIYIVFNNKIEGHIFFPLQLIS